MKFNIGHLSFSTKAEAKEYTSNVIKRGERNIYPDDDEFNFFISLIKNHQNSVKLLEDGVIFFMILKNDFNPTKIDKVMIKTKKDELKSFSWNKCCGFKRKKDKLTIALRECIRPQIMDFKLKNEIKCCYCNKIEGSLTFCDFHIDHIKPFILLVDEFLQINTLPLPSEFIKTEKLLYKFIDEDEDFKKKWYDFHLLNASLQVLCCECNEKKGKNFI
jgi:hypothetical protein